MESKKSKIILSIILGILSLSIIFKISYNIIWNKNHPCLETQEITQCYYTTVCDNGLSTIGPCRTETKLVCKDMTICVNRK